MSVYVTVKATAMTTAQKKMLSGIEPKTFCTDCLITENDVILRYFLALFQISRRNLALVVLCPVMNRKAHQRDFVYVQREINEQNDNIK